MKQTAFPNFRAYQLALELHRAAEKTVDAIPAYFKDQLLRASLSIALNLAEGNGRRTTKDRKRFFTMAFGSLREVQALIDLHPRIESLRTVAHSLGGHLYRLTR